MAVNQLKGGVALSYVRVLLTNVVGLVLTPFIIRSLGTAEYGLYIMIATLVGYMSVLDFGLKKTVVRFVAKYKTEKNKIGEENFLAHIFIIYGFISIVIIVGGLILYNNLDYIYRNTLSLSELKMAKTLFLIQVFRMSIALPGSTFEGICSGYEEFIFPRAIIVGRYIIRSLMIVCLLLLGGDAIGIVIIDVFVNMLLISGNALVAFKRLKIKIKLHQFDTGLIKTVFGYSIWIFVFAIAEQMRWQFGQLILGVMYSTSVVAVYAVGTILGSYYGAFSKAIESVFLPKAIKMIGKNASPEQLTNMFIRITRIILLILLFVLGGFILVGQDFIYFWAGADFSEAYLYVILMFIGLILFLSQGFAFNILEARGILKFAGLSQLLFTVCGAILGAFLAREYKGLGMIIGSVVFMLLERIVISVYYNRTIKLDMIRYYKEIMPLFVLSGLTILVSNYLSQYLPNLSIKFFLMRVVAYTILYASTFWFILTVDEKKLVYDVISKIQKVIAKKRKN